jgi:EAL and modified HD-GYP domain-containing signal transduction protein
MALPNASGVIALDSPRLGPCIGRQAICDRGREVQAYELLFRSSSAARAGVQDGDEATFRVILNSLVETGLDHVVGSHVAYLNVTRNSVLCEYPRFFPKERVVLEILEDVIVDLELTNRLRLYKDEGFRIAMDDFVDRPDLRPLVELADIIKLDVQVHDRRSLARYVEEFRGHTLLAEKVESQEQFQHCLDLGFDLFQGYHLDHPTTHTVLHVPTRQLPVLHALAILFGRDAVSAEEVVALFESDLALSVRILRAACAVRPDLDGRISTVGEAAAIMGLSRIRSWITLLSLAGFEDQDQGLGSEGLVRGKACELLAAAGGDPRQYYLAGLLTVLGDLLGLPLQAVLDCLPVSEELRRALLEGEGRLGAVLGAVCRARTGARHVPWVAAPVLEAIRAGEAWAASVRREIGC